MKLVKGEAPDLYDENVPDSAALAQGRAGREGAEFDQLAMDRLGAAGGTILRRGGYLRGVSIDALVQGSNGSVFTVLAHGNVDSDRERPGLWRTDTVRKAGDSAYLLHCVVKAPPVLIMTSHVPKATGRNQQAARLLAMHNAVVFDVIGMEDLASFHRLQRYLTSDPSPTEPEAAPWRELPELQLSFELWSPDA